MKPALLVVVLLLAVVAARRIPDTSKTARARELDEFGRHAYLRYLHIPKTGTSLIYALRNYLSACTVKDFSCNGWYGGNVNPLSGEKPWANHHHHEAMDEPELSCNSHMIACQPRSYHLPYSWMDGTRTATVTMLRHPQKLAHSGFRFSNWVLKVDGKPEETLKEFLANNDNTMTKMLGGIEFNFPITDGQTKTAGFQTRTQLMDMLLERAFRNLLNGTVFWGITDYWNESICMFHKELNGPGPRATEFKNTRQTAANSNSSTPHSAKPQAATGMAEYQRLRNAWDYKLYAKVMPLFLDRMEAVGCAGDLDLTAARQHAKEIEAEAEREFNETEADMEARLFV